MWEMTGRAPGPGLPSEVFHPSLTASAIKVLRTGTAVALRLTLILPTYLRIKRGRKDKNRLGGGEEMQEPKGDL